MTVLIDDSHDGQRLDNFLIGYLKKVPSDRIYRAIRKGEVRVNSKRVEVNYHLAIGDLIRVPPLYQSTVKKLLIPNKSLLISLELRILFEDKDLLIIDKPSGLPVHGGSGVNVGLIEALRMIRPKSRLLKLVHRLDRETSGCLLVAKKRSLLVMLHTLLVERKIVKQYLLLVKGRWQWGNRKVKMPLNKNILQSGERMVKVDESGKMAITFFRPILSYSFSCSEVTLMEARPLTGRTHQIRVHASYLGHPIAGDEKYGDKLFNQEIKALGLRRLFLHSSGIMCSWDNRIIGVCAPLDADLFHFLEFLNRLKT